MKNQLFKLLSYMLPKEKNITKNYYEILALLFNSNYAPITTKESIELFKEVSREFHNELNKRSLEAKIEIADIDEYYNTYYSRTKID